MPVYEAAVSKIDLNAVICPQIHSGERPFVCKVCQRPFKKSSQLKRHERIHTGIKSYLCDECGTGFLTASSLKLHRTTHTGEKRFMCEECGKGFRVHNRLVRHMACHTTDELFLVKQDASSMSSAAATLPSSLTAPTMNDVPSMVTQNVPAFTDLELFQYSKESAERILAAQQELVEREQEQRLQKQQQLRDQQQE